MWSFLALSKLTEETLVKIKLVNASPTVIRAIAAGSSKVLNGCSPTDVAPPVKP